MSLKSAVRRSFATANFKIRGTAPYIKRLNVFRPSKRAHESLSSDLRKELHWNVDLNARSGKGELYAAWSGIGGGHKWQHYFPIYEDAFAPIRNRPVRFLEIGVARGGSLKLWRHYLHPGSIVVGIDIDRACEQFDDPASNVHVRIGSQANAEFLQSVVKEFGPFDVVLDDGSHVPSDMIGSFNVLFDEGLIPGGVYIVEDIHTNYWVTRRTTNLSFVDFTKHLVDLMHSQYWHARGEQQYRLGAEQRKMSIIVPRITKLVKKIEINDSVFVFRKHEGDPPLPFSIRT